VLDGPAVLRLLIRRSWLLILLGALGAGLGWLFSEAQPRRYAAEQEVVLTGQVVNPLTVDVSQATQDPERLVQTQVGLMTSETVLKAAEARLGREPEELEALSTPDSNLVTLRTEAATRAVAAEDLRAYVGAYIRLVRAQGSEQIDDARRTLRRRIRSYEQGLEDVRGDRRPDLLAQRRAVHTSLDQLDAARSLGATLAEPVGEARALDELASPQPTLNIAVGAAAGVLLGTMLALGVRRRSRS